MHSPASYSAGDSCIFTKNVKTGNNDFYSEYRANIVSIGKILHFHDSAFSGFSRGFHSLGSLLILSFPAGLNVETDGNF